MQRIQGFVRFAIYQLVNHNKYLKDILYNVRNIFKRQRRTRLISTLPIFMALAYQAQISCLQAQVQQINKQELVSLMNRPHQQQFIIVVYNRFKKLDDKQFAVVLQSTIKECHKLNINKIYLIDSRQKQHLQKIIKILKNQQEDPSEQIKQQQDKQKKKKKQFYFYYKSKSFKEAFELSNNKQYPIVQQISQIRHFQVKVNNPNIIQEINSIFNNSLLNRKNIVVKECIAEGSCVQNYKKQIKGLIDAGMMVGKAQQFKFELIMDTPVGILGKSSQYVKNFNKFVAQASKNVPNKRQETILFRKDLFGAETVLFSDWFQRQGNKYSYDHFLMFLKPRIHYISKINTFSDLLWYFRTVKSSLMPSISLNNTQKWAKTNTFSTIQALKLIHSAFPKLNYLVINTDKVAELFKHLYADEKYVLFQQDSNPIWKKTCLNFDKLQKTSNPIEREALFNKQYKQKIQSFINEPKLQHLVSIQRQLQISHDKLRWLKETQLNGKNKNKYLIRVCRENCLRNLNKQLYGRIQDIQKINVYWIDNKTQNIGVKEGNYMLYEGKLINLTEFIV